MAQPFPTELRDFIDAEIACGHHASEGEIVEHALRLYRKHRQERARLDERLAQAAAEERTGQVMDLDIEAVIAELEAESDSARHHQ